MLYYSHPKERITMITIKYRDDMGDVQASFDSLTEYEKFRDEFILKEKARRAAQLAKIRNAQEEADKKAALQREELSRLTKVLIAKAISYGVTPSGFVDLIKESVFSAARDRCSHDSECDEENDWDADGANSDCASTGVGICIR